MKKQTEIKLRKLVREELKQQIKENEKMKEFKIKGANVYRHGYNYDISIKNGRLYNDKNKIRLAFDDVNFKDEDLFNDIKKTLTKHKIKHKLDEKRGYIYIDYCVIPKEASDKFDLLSDNEKLNNTIFTCKMTLSKAKKMKFKDMYKYNNQQIRKALTVLFPILKKYATKSQ